VVIGEPTALSVIASGKPTVAAPVKVAVSSVKAMFVSRTVRSKFVKFWEMSPGMVRSGNRSPTVPSS